VKLMSLNEARIKYIEEACDNLEGILSIVRKEGCHSYASKISGKCAGELPSNDRYWRQPQIGGSTRSDVPQGRNGSCGVKLTSSPFEILNLSTTLVWSQDIPEVGLLEDLHLPSRISALGGRKSSLESVIDSKRATKMKSASK
jgi:hypothetical protein